MWRWRIELTAGLLIVVALLIFVLLLKIVNSCYHGRVQQEQQLGDHTELHQMIIPGEQMRRIPGPNPSAKSQRRSLGIPLALRGFDWKDYPALMSEALEHGWAAFAVAQVNRGSRFPAEIKWEIGLGTEFMQVIRSNPGLPPESVSARAFQFFKSALPLPGPFLGPYSFPQESYFEVTIISPVQAPAAATSSAPEPENSSPMKPADHESQNTRLIRSASSDALFTRIMAIGLVAGGNSSFGDVGSIGYYSNGQILLNGRIYTDERVKKRAWVPGPARTDTTVGCGFNPKSRRVFFTLNGEIVCHADCTNAEEFGCPLHLGFMTNHDSLAVLNLGQAMFEFAPENARRNPDPGNHRPPVTPQRTAGKTSSLQYDSGELFSVAGRLDSQRMNDFSQDFEFHRPPAPPSETESDLFDIVLDEGKIASR